jgi:hypothetical protein
MPSKTKKHTQGRDEISSGVSRTCNAVGEGYGSYVHRVVMTKGQFESVKLEVKSKLDRFARGIGHNVSVYVDFKNSRFSYLEAGVEGYKEEHNENVINTVNSAIRSACKKLELPYVEPRVTPFTPTHYPHTSLD